MWLVSLACFQQWRIIIGQRDYIGIYRLNFSSSIYQTGKSNIYIKSSKLLLHFVGYQSTRRSNNGAARGVTIPVNLFERVRHVVYVFCPGERESWITQRLFLSWDKTSSVCFVNVRQGNEHVRVFNKRRNGFANKSGDQLTRLLFEPDFDRLLFPSRARRFPFSLSMVQLANIYYREGKAFLFEKKIYHYRLSYLWCPSFVHFHIEHNIT